MKEQIERNIPFENRFLVLIRFLGVRAGFSLQSFCHGEWQKGFSLQSLTQKPNNRQNPLSHIFNLVP